MNYSRNGSLTAEHAEERRENQCILKKFVQPFWLNQYFPQAFDLSACIGVYLRLTAFF